MEHTEITLSVRALVEFAYSSGSLEPGFRSGAAMAEGTRSHQLIQKQYKEGDRKEVYLKTGIAYGELLFQIDGRCDGLLTAEDGSLTVEEIKSMAGIPDPALEGKEVHWAQAYMYAYMLATDLELPCIQVKLTYVQRGSEAQYSLYREMSREALTAFALETVSRYAPYAVMMVRYKAKRGESITNLSFPFSAYRPGQRHFAAAVYTSIAEGRTSSPRHQLASAKPCPPCSRRSKRWVKARRPVSSI